VKAVAHSQSELGENPTGCPAVKQWAMGMPTWSVKSLNPGESISQHARIADAANRVVPNRSGETMTRSRRIANLSLVAAAAFAMLVKGPAAQARAKHPAPGGLWVDGFNYILEYQGRALVRGGEPHPRLKFGNPDFSNAPSIAFDQKRDLWFVYYSDLSALPEIVEISRGEVAALASGGRIRAKVVLVQIGYTTTGLSGPYSIAFDRSGDLWTSVYGKNGLMEFLPDQIAASGTPTPSIFITAPNFNPRVIRFDDSENLWVTQPVSTQAPAPAQVWRFTPSERTASGAPDPSLVVDLPASFAPADIAFDSSGNLWTAGRTTDASVLLMFSAADISGTGEVAPAPSVTITSAAFGVPSIYGGICLSGLDFDSAGGLWLSVQANGVECVGNPQIVGFKPDELTSSGDLAPAVVIGQRSKRKRLQLPGAIRFGPKVE